MNFFLVFVSKKISLKKSILNSKIFLIFYHVSFIIKKKNLFANHGLKLKIDVLRIMAWIQPQNHSSSLKNMIKGCVGTWIVLKFQEIDKCYKENMDYYSRESILTIMFGFINFLFNKINFLSTLSSYHW